MIREIHRPLNPDALLSAGGIIFNLLSNIYILLCDSFYLDSKLDTYIRQETSVRA